MAFRDGPFENIKVPLVWTSAVAVVVAIVGALALLVTDGRDQASPYQGARDGVDATAGPVSGVLAAPARWLGGMRDGIGGYFFAVSDNAGSCFLARGLLRDSDAVLLNGDTVFEPAILRRALRAPEAPITVTIDRKPAYDTDDMKVSVEGTRLLAIGKTLQPAETDGESIGLLLFRGRGGALFADGVEDCMRRPDGLRRWYLSVIHALAPAGGVRVASIEGLAWGEIDYPADIARAEAVVRGLGADDAPLTAPPLAEVLGGR